MRERAALVVVRMLVLSETTAGTEPGRYTDAPAGTGARPLHGRTGWYGARPPHFQPRDFSHCSG